MLKSLSMMEVSALLDSITINVSLVLLFFLQIAPLWKMFMMALCRFVNTSWMYISQFHDIFCFVSIPECGR